MSQPDPPKQRNPSKDYGQGIETYLQHLPELLQAEQGARDTYDPQRVEQFLNLQARYGPAQTQMQLDRLHQIDPESAAVRNQLAQNVFGDLQSGYSLPAGYNRELEQGFRGAQAARGNILGRGAGSAETLYKGQAALNLYQQHLQNAGNFLSSPSPTQQLLAVPGVGVDRSAGYTNPNAGYAGQAAGQQQFQNLLALYQLSGGGGNPWAGAAAGAASGAAAGYGVGGAYGAIGGAVVGGVGGYYSSLRLKENVETAGEHNGYPLVTFNYTGDKRRWRGVIAEAIRLLKPSAVSVDEDGYELVDYGALGLTMEAVT